MTKRMIGADAESVACNYLLARNLHFIERNFISRFGEIDLIMRDQSYLVFVEVRKRSKGFDDALNSISSSKQRKMVKTASYYLLKLHADVACRFDVVAIDQNNRCLWLQNVICL